MEAQRVPTFLDGALDTLRSAFPDQPDVSIEAAIQEALRAAAATESVPLDVLGCDTDFDAACPIGFPMHCQ